MPAIAGVTVLSRTMGPPGWLLLRTLDRPPNPSTLLPIQLLLRSTRPIRRLTAISEANQRESNCSILHIRTSLVNPYTRLRIRRARCHEDAFMALFNHVNEKAYAKR